jgi:lipid II:glycine glycyltransferase (peptidoglycan interpeptide bridge formation enzyme)
MDFLQSNQWRKFQESVGRKTYLINSEYFYASIIEHTLSIVGRYFYVPRGPQIRIKNYDLGIKNNLDRLIALAKKVKIGWIRIDPESEEVLELIKKAADCKVQKAPHDMQPKELFIIDINQSESEILARMKQKTRYNIRLAEKHEVKVTSVSNGSESQNKYFEEFLRLVKITAQRDGITAHPENYYRKMWETLPVETARLYMAEYEEKIIAANLMIFYGDATIYLHGASDNEHRNVMAPYLLHWQAIKDAKAKGFKNYDFGGVSDDNEKWKGITKFKLGFSESTRPIKFPGSYDIVINKKNYILYRILEKIKKYVS